MISRVSMFVCNPSTYIPNTAVCNNTLKGKINTIDKHAPVPAPQSEKYANIPLSRLHATHTKHTPSIMKVNHLNNYYNHHDMKLYLPSPSPNVHMSIPIIQILQSDTAIQALAWAINVIIHTARVMTAKHFSATMIHSITKQKWTKRTSKVYDKADTNVILYYH